MTADPRPDPPLPVEVVPLNGAAGHVRTQGEDDGDDRPVAAAKPPLSLGVADFFATCGKGTDWLLEPYVFKGGFTLLQGPPKSGKTWLAAWWAASCAARGLPVLFVEEEGAREILRDRLQPFMPKPEDFNATLRVSFRNRLRLDSRASVEKIVVDAVQHKAQVIFLDPFVALHAADEQDAGAVSRGPLAGVRMLIALTGCAVVLLHHTRKGDSWNKTSGAEAQSSDARGSGALVGEVDHVLAVKGLPMAKRKDGEVGFILENPDTRVAAPFGKRTITIDTKTGESRMIEDGAKPQEQVIEELLERLVLALHRVPHWTPQASIRKALMVKKERLSEAVFLGVSRGIITTEVNKGIALV